MDFLILRQVKNEKRFIVFRKKIGIAHAKIATKKKPSEHSV